MDDLSRFKIGMWSRQIDKIFSTVAMSILLAYNHPSGNPTPSIRDRELTATLVALGDQLGVKVLDHLVIGGEKCVGILSDGTASMP